MNNLPDDFCQRLCEILPQDKYENVLQTFALKRKLSFRINTLMGSDEEILAEFGALQPQAVPWLENAYVIEEENRRELSSSAAFNDGRIYIQGLSSLLPTLILDPQPGETILDLAAAPGGKTTHIAALMQNEGRLSAVEAVKGRFFKLKANLERSGVSISKCYLTDGRSVGRKCPEMFDRVLLDAPCSSEARFSTLDPDSWSHWSLRKVREAARKQKGLIFSAWNSLKTGGILVYCTCSFAPEENELIVEKLLKKTAAELLEVSLPITNFQVGLTNWAGKDLNPELYKCRRILPNEWMDGFFLAAIRKP